MKTYEGMFLFDPTTATDWSNVEAEIDRIMKRADAELLVSKKWDERRLAYEIKGRNRGCYVLTYFKAPPDKITGIERDVQLSEHVLRCLVLRADHVTEEKMNEDSPAESMARPPEDQAPGAPRTSDEKPPRSEVKKPEKAEQSVPTKKESEKAEPAAETAESN